MSPASIITHELYGYGDLTLHDRVGGVDLAYSVHSFFQVNIPAFELTLTHIKEVVGGIKPLIDFYAGVGSIGFAVGADTLVEVDSNNIDMAKKNMAKKAVKIIQAPSERALDYITGGGGVIFDPPRAGLHRKLIDKLCEVQPHLICYLSCNPVTQARDIALLQNYYRAVSIQGYNFFPRTPHIESLVILRLR